MSPCCRYRCRPWLGKASLSSFAVLLVTCDVLTNLGVWTSGYMAVSAFSPTAISFRPRAIPIRPRTSTLPLSEYSIKGSFVYEGGEVELPPIAQAQLEEFLQHPDMIEEVSKVAMAESVEFANVLFEPVPYSPTTKHGMPADIEQAYYLNPDYTIVHIPPPVLIRAHIFKPSKLCAVYRVIQLTPQGQEAMEERRRAVQERQAGEFHQAFHEQMEALQTYQDQRQDDAEVYWDEMDQAENSLGGNDQNSDDDKDDFDFDEYIV